MESFHQTTLLSLDLFGPVRSASGHQDVGGEWFDMSIQFSMSVDMELGGKMDGAVCAIFQAVWTIFLGVRCGKQVFTVKSISRPGFLILFSTRRS
jgi:hypothetical protein